MTVFRLPHINKVRSRGKVYYYHRPTRTRLPGRPGEPEFMAAYAAAEGRIPSDAKPGTLGSLIEAYRASPEFSSLAAETKRDYQRVLNWLGKGRETPLPAITSQFVFSLRDTAFEQHKRRFANYVIQVLSLLFNWGRPRGFVASNPAQDVAKLRKPRGTGKVNRPWRWEELTAVLVAAETHPGVRAAIALAAFTGLRQADVLKLTWSACADGRVIAQSQKTAIPTGVPIHSLLASVLDATPRLSPVIVCGQRGAPFSATGFRTELRKLLKRLEADGIVEPGLTFHGLRHTAGTMLADAGCDSRMIQSVLGLKTERMAAHYTQEADRLRQADEALARLEKALLERTGGAQFAKQGGQSCKTPPQMAFGTKRETP